MKRLTVDIWSDIACPWCYVGKRRFEAALADFEHPEALDVTWHSFELDPSAPAASEEQVDYPGRLAKKYGVSSAQAKAMIERMTSVAAADGLDFRFDRIRPGNTFDAHRLIHFAHEKGLQDALKERLLKAYLTEGRAMSDRGALTELAESVGLDAAAVAAVLSTDAYAADVRADERAAAEIGIRGVPFFVIDGRVAVSGAQPSEVFLRALERAFREMPATELAEGAACGPSGCE